MSQLSSSVTWPSGRSGTEGTQQRLFHETVLLASHCLCLPLSGFSYTLTTVVLASSLCTHS